MDEHAIQTFQIVAPCAYTFTKKAHIRHLHLDKYIYCMSTNYAHNYRERIVHFISSPTHKLATEQQSSEVD